MNLKSAPVPDIQAHDETRLRGRSGSTSRRLPPDGDTAPNRTFGHSGAAKARRQLLEAAGEVFAEAGFRNATVREICRRAGANVAAVNYHFGDKERLYAAVLRHSQQKAFEKYPPLLGADADALPAEKLHAFVRSFLLRIFDKGSTAWFGKMMSREMVEPTGALETLLEMRIRPMADLLGGLVAEILGCSRHDEKVRLCCFSIVSQCVFFHHCRTMIIQLFPEQRLDAATAEQLAGHVTRFSLAAMNHLRDPKTANTTAKFQVPSSKIQRKRNRKTQNQT